MTWKVEGNSSNCHKIAAPIGIGVQILKTKGVGGGGETNLALYNLNH